MSVLGFTQKVAASLAAVAPTKADTDIAADLEAIASAIRRGECGAGRVVLHFVEPGGAHTYYAWRCSVLDHVGVLEVGKRTILEESC